MGRQQEVFLFIKLNPGVHLREMQRRLTVSSMGNLEYHISVLKKLDLIIEETEGGYKRYYPVQGKVKNKKLLALLMQKVPRRITILMLEKMRSGGYLDVGVSDQDGEELTDMGKGEGVGDENDDISQDCTPDPVPFGVTPLELMDALDLSSPALSYHLSKMYKLGILIKEKQGKNAYYFIADPEEVLRLIVSYEQSFTDGLVSSLMAGWGL